MVSNCNQRAISMSRWKIISGLENGVKLQHLTCIAVNSLYNIRTRKWCQTATAYMLTKNIYG